MGALDCGSMRADHRGIETPRATLQFCLVSSLLAIACATDAPHNRSAESVQTFGFHIIAHRGGAGHAPENTLPAFRLSLANGFNEVELDVQLSLDEVLVLYHDQTLELKTGREGSVGVYSAEELKGFDIGSWFDREHPEIARPFAGTPIITLSDLFEEFGLRLYYHVEIKGEDPRVARLLHDAIKADGLVSRVNVTSFSFDQLTRFRSLAAEIPICWLLKRNRDLTHAADRDARLLARQRVQVEAALNAGFSHVAIPAPEISAEIVSFTHANALGIRAWGVETIEDEQRVIASGSDGATTDWPERLSSQLAESHRQRLPE
jgi:glycerophosphoryl diester phosphodiesterase